MTDQLEIERSGGELKTHDGLPANDAFGEQHLPGRRGWRDRGRHRGRRRRRLGRDEPEVVRSRPGIDLAAADPRYRVSGREQRVLHLIRRQAGIDRQEQSGNAGDRRRAERRSAAVGRADVGVHHHLAPRSCKLHPRATGRPVVELIRSRPFPRPRGLPGTRRDTADRCRRRYRLPRSRSRPCPLRTPPRRARRSRTRSRPG